MRVQRFFLRLLRYDLDFVYVPGQQLHIPDMLSRTINTDNDDLDSVGDDSFAMINTVIRSMNCSEEAMNKIAHETKNDPILSKVTTQIINGWPTNKYSCSNDVKPYYSIRADLSIHKGLILFHDRIVIPLSLQTDILQRLHEGHQGQERCKMLARQTVYWRGINSDIEETVNSCSKCLSCRKLPAREPLKPHEVPDRPWEKISTDLFSCEGIRYQIIVDYFSKWVEVDQVPHNAVSGDVVKHLLETFSRFGLPNKIFSDGDPLYTSAEFDKFCNDYNIDHDFSSAGYPRSNGQVEIKIKFIKDLIHKCGKINLNMALLQYRATPLGPGIDSPAKIFFGRNLRTKVPIVDKLLINDQDPVYKQILEEKKLSDKYFHDRKCKNERPKFSNSDLIQYRDNIRDKIWKSGKVLNPINTRSYEIVNNKGNIVRRNSSLLVADKTGKPMSVEAGDCVGCIVPYQNEGDTLSHDHKPKCTPSISNFNNNVPNNPTPHEPAIMTPKIPQRRSQKSKVVYDGPLRRSERIKNQIKE